MFNYRFRKQNWCVYPHLTLHEILQWKHLLREVLSDLLILQQYHDLMNRMTSSKGQPQSTVDFRIPLRKNFRDKILQFKEKDNKTYKEKFIVYCHYKKHVSDSLGWFKSDRERTKIPTTLHFQVLQFLSQLKILIILNTMMVMDHFLSYETWGYKLLLTESINDRYQYQTKYPWPLKQNLRRVFKLIIWNRSVIGWRSRSRYLIAGERHLACISLKLSLGLRKP